MALLKLMTKTFAIGLGGYWALSNFPFLVFCKQKAYGKSTFRMRRWPKISGPIDTVAMARSS